MVQGPSKSCDPIVQYVLLRRDLVAPGGLGWPLGSVVAQGCHAAVAAVWQHRGDAATKAYCGPAAINDMHTVTLEVPGEAQLVDLASRLDSEGIAHKLWLEKPESIPTCLATKPYRKSDVAPLLKKYKLFK
eukprot:SM000015S01241  [mRNA]  locus=s15:726906:727763:- [translate_table: standard]